MTPEEKCLNTAEGRSVFMRVWEHPETPFKSIIYIAHGLGEHSARYQWLAEQLAEKGYLVIAHDHAGHGKTRELNQADIVWSSMCEDLTIALDWVRQRYPGLPLTLLGHSMGSVIALQHALNSADSIDQLVLSGCFYPYTFDNQLVHGLAKLERWRTEGGRISPLIEKMMGLSLNQGLSPRKTSMDWLSRDLAVGEAYIEDPLSRLSQSNNGWVEVNQGFREAAKLLDGSKNALNAHNLPIYLLAGDADPLNKSGKLFDRLIRGLKNAGFSSIESVCYPGGRHEMFNETNREEVAGNLIAWLENERISSAV